MHFKAIFWKTLPVLIYTGTEKNSAGSCAHTEYIVILIKSYQTTKITEQW